MKIGIEGIPFFGNRSGVGQYAKRLTETMASLEKSPQIQIIRPLMPHRKLQETPIKPSKNLSYRVVRWMPPILYYQLFKRTGWAPPYDLVALRKYDAMLFFNFVAFPVRKKTPSYIFIYDLSYIHHKEFTSPKNQAWVEKFVPRSIKQARKIITISENSKQEIIDYYNVSPGDIDIVYPAVDHKEYQPQTKQKVSAVKAKFGINKPYILSVCTLEPRKNLIGVLNAFDKLPEELKRKYALVLAGGKGWLDGELEKKYGELEKKYTIIKTGYVDDSDLPPLYSGADLFVYPAFYEGFGMPPLEAMACGTPVITANNSSLPEVVGNAAITIEASDTIALAKQAERVLTDPKLSQELSKKGLVQANKFDWQESAEKLLKIIEETI